MSLLSDRDIAAALQDGQLRVTPGICQPIQPASIDIRLGRCLKIVTGDRIFEHDLIDAGPYQIVQGDFLLAQTLEWFELGDQIAAQLVGKSSRAREGIQVEAAGFFDPGWQGIGTLEIAMLSPQPRTLEHGMQICQLRFFWLSSPAERLYGNPALGSHYQRSAHPVESYRRR